MEHFFGVAVVVVLIPGHLVPVGVPVGEGVCTVWRQAAGTTTLSCTQCLCASRLYATCTPRPG